MILAGMFLMILGLGILVVMVIWPIAYGLNYFVFKFVYNHLSPTNANTGLIEPLYILNLYVSLSPHLISYINNKVLLPTNNPHLS